MVHRPSSSPLTPSAFTETQSSRLIRSGGRKPTGRDAVEWAREAEERGAGEILLTSMDRDGTGAGFDCELTRVVSEAVRIPVIASGGGGDTQSFIDVFQRGRADAALAASIFHFGLRPPCRPQTRIATCGDSDEVAMLIPSIDLMGGKIVQLVQGERKALEFEDFEEWIARFSSYPLVQLIDLDAAMGNGNNRALVREFAGRLPCQVGGGIRSMQAAEEILATGARRVILGSCLIRDGRPDATFAEQVARATSPDKLVFAIDSKGGTSRHSGMARTHAYYASRDDHEPRALVRCIPIYAHRHGRSDAGHPPGRGSPVAGCHQQAVHRGRRDCDERADR